MKSSIAPNVTYIDPTGSNVGNAHFWTPMIHVPSGEVRLTPKRFTIAESTQVIKGESVPVWTISHDYFALPLGTDLAADSVVQIAGQEGFALTADEAQAGASLLAYVNADRRGDTDACLALAQTLQANGGEVAGFSIYNA